MRAPERAALLKESGKLGFSSRDVTRMGFGGRTYLWQEVRDNRLIATKRGRHTIFMLPHVVAWLASMPTIKSRRGSIEQPKLKRTRRASGLYYLK